MRTSPISYLETMPTLVERFVRELVSLWYDASLDLLHGLPAYEASDQASREGALATFLEALSAELAQHPPQGQEQRQAVQARILTAFEAFARQALGWEDRHIDLLLGRGLVEIGAEFARKARRFDPDISGADIFQASRNVWTMNGIQLLLGLPARLTPSVFAYSMLYPYTDNYLDDSSISPQEKLTFSERFRERLLGRPVEPFGSGEQRIWRLVSMIEEEHDRDQRPQVYASLLAIHEAQEKSIHLLRPVQHDLLGAPYEADVLAISLEKGGASVLADGYLVAGDLPEDQARFLFGFGAYLQLLDDLQDIDQDRSHRQMTIYCQSAQGPWKLDALANRTLNFGNRVMEGLPVLGAEGTAPLQELMRSSLPSLLVDAVGSQRRHYSRRYLRAMEQHSAFRFRFLKRVRKRLARERASLMGLIEAFAVEE